MRFAHLGSIADSPAEARVLNVNGSHHLRLVEVARSGRRVNADMDGGYQNGGSERGVNKILAA